jgi:hypothetical protein
MVCPHINDVNKWRSTQEVREDIRVHKPRAEVDEKGLVRGKLPEVFENAV